MNLRGKKRDITKTMHSCIYYMYSATVEYVILMLDIFLAMIAIARSQNPFMVLHITNKTKAHQKFQKSWKFCRKVYLGRLHKFSEKLSLQLRLLFICKRNPFLNKCINFYKVQTHVVPNPEVSLEFCTSASEHYIVHSAPNLFQNALVIRANMYFLHQLRSIFFE